jgi:hypothetical protein
MDFNLINVDYLILICLQLNIHMLHDDCLTT